jgi:hypothetical protein
MRSLRSVLKQSPAIAISAAALVFAAGTSVSFATTSANSAPGTRAESAAATILTWHPLPTAKGWHGRLRYAVNDGVVYLSGLAWTHAPGWPAMTSLPRGARPTSPSLQMPVAYSKGATKIILFNNGVIMPTFPDNGRIFVSLSGVSYGLGS